MMLDSHAWNVSTVNNSVPDLVQKISEAFGRIITESSSLSQAHIRVATTRWSDERGKFRVWAGNVGAHQRGSSSLAYRLRQAEQLFRAVQDALEELLETLNMIRNEFSGDDEEENLLSSIAETAPTVDDSYVESLYDDVTDYVQGLFRITTLIRQPSRRDQLLRKVPEDKEFEQFDIDHVRDKFPLCEEYLIKRLGTANSQRRANLKFFKHHHENMASSLSLATEVGHAAPENQAIEVIQTVTLQSGAAITTIEPDAAEAASFSLSTVEKESRLPKRPQTADRNEPFECPICFFVIKAPTRLTWLEHVTSDLQSYVCLNADCRRGSVMYESSTQWLEHQRSCGWGLTKDMEERVHCPLCLETLIWLKFESHISKHFRDLALFILPDSILRDGDGNDEVSGGDQEQESELYRRELADADAELHTVRTASGHWQGWNDEVEDDFYLTSTESGSSAEAERAFRVNEPVELHDYDLHGPSESFKHEQPNKSQVLTSIGNLSTSSLPAGLQNDTSLRSHAMEEVRVRQDVKKGKGKEKKKAQKHEPVHTDSAAFSPQSGAVTLRGNTLRPQLPPLPPRGSSTYQSRSTDTLGGNTLRPQILPHKSSTYRSSSSGTLAYEKYRTPTSSSQKRGSLYTSDTRTSHVTNSLYESTTTSPQQSTSIRNRGGDVFQAWQPSRTAGY